MATSPSFLAGIASGKMVIARGTHLNQWRIGDVIGEGMCGVVYCGETATQEKVHIRFFNKHTK